MMEDEEFDAAIIEEFIAESKEHLATIEDDFLTLEKNQDDQELLGKVFRAIHSMKGSAGFLGFSKVGDLTHVMETLLTKMRSGEIRPETVYVDALLEGVDLLNLMLGDIKKSNEVDIAVIHSTLSSLIDNTPLSSSAEHVEGAKEEPAAENEAPLKQELVEIPPSKIEKKPAAKDTGTPKNNALTEVVQGGTIRINLDIADKLMMLAGELVLIRNQQLLNVDKSNPMAANIVQRLDIVTSDLQETIMRTRMQPLDNVFGKFPRVVRELAKTLGKKIEIIITGSEEELDKTILESLTDPLTHLLRNSCDHGLENPDERQKAGKHPEGLIRLSAYHESGQINIKIVDDGKGIDPKALKKAALKKGLRTEAELEKLSDKECISLIMLPGFSTAEKVSNVSGRGVGMDVVKTNLERLGGVINIESTIGEGTTVHLRLPLTLAIIPCLIVIVGAYRYAIPQVNLVELVCLYDEEILTKLEYTDDLEIYRLRDTLLPMVRLHEILAKPTPFNDQERIKIIEKYRRRQKELLAKHDQGSGKNTPYRDSLNFAVLKIGAKRFGLIVDQVSSTEEIVVKPMHSALKSLRCYAGATVLGDGQVALIMDVEGVANHAGVLLEGSADLLLNPSKEMHLREKQTVILFKSGEKELYALPLPLIKRIERVSTADFETVSDKEFITINGISTLIIRLDHHLNASPCLMQEEMYLLLPKHINRPFGVLISSLQDIVEVPMELNVESYMDAGIMGSLIVKDRMTLFIDLYALIEKAEPGWFEFPENPRSSAEGTHLLLVEDSPFFMHLLKGYLEEAGYPVTTAANGKIALDLMAASDFDLIVSDLEMPEMDGWEFMQNVRTKSRQKDIPALALTSVQSAHGRQRAEESGFNRYEIKIDRGRLLSTIIKLLPS
jgi:two-component system chemotaxis sensor kinase CheA